jgi:polyisoprenoid-binding protein YceI
VAAPREALMRAALLLVALLAAAPARADDCRAVDAARGKAAFEVAQAGAPFRGGFRRFGGTVCLAGGKVARIDVWLDPASVDAGLPEIDDALKGEDFFAVQRYPRIEYSSDSVRDDAGGGVAQGTLRIKGARHALDVPFRTKALEGGGLEISGKLAVNRLAYSIGSGQWSDTKWLGAEVTVSFEVSLPPAGATAPRRNPAAG